MTKTFLSSPDLPKQLRTLWLLLCCSASLLLTGVWVTVRTSWSPHAAELWALVSAVGLVGYLIYLRRSLHLNHPPGDTLIRPSLGIANLTSITRGGLAILLMGFILPPQPRGWLAWLPGGLYILSSLMDFLDGYLARRLEQTTLLGIKLDLDLDGLVVLAGCLLVVRYGQAPPWYLLVGLARYLFLLGGWIQQRRGQPIYELSHNPTRRALAGSQMGFLAAILLPVFPPHITRWAASLFMLPFIVQFTLDFLEYVGVRRSSASSPAHPFGLRVLGNALPLLFRVCLLLALVWSAAWSAAAVGWVLAVAPALGALLIAVGALGRTTAMLSMISAGFFLRHDPSLLPGWLLLVSSIGAFFSGSGFFSLWRPEDRWVFRRAGGGEP